MRQPPADRSRSTTQVNIPTTAEVGNLGLRARTDPAATGQTPNKGGCKRSGQQQSPEPKNHNAKLETGKGRHQKGADSLSWECSPKTPTWEYGKGLRPHRTSRTAELTGTPPGQPQPRRPAPEAQGCLESRQDRMVADPLCDPKDWTLGVWIPEDQQKVQPCTIKYSVTTGKQNCKQWQAKLQAVAGTLALKRTE